MLRALRFLLGNLLVGWVLAKFMGQYLNYPPELPLRLRPEVPGLVTAAVFSLLALPANRLALRLRLPALLLAAILSVAVSGAFSLPFAPAEGALIGLVIAVHSPLVVLAGMVWAWLGSLLNYPPVKPVAPRPEPVAREPVPVAEEWIGSRR